MGLCSPSTLFASLPFSYWLVTLLSQDKDDTCSLANPFRFSRELLFSHPPCRWSCASVRGGDLIRFFFSCAHLVMIDDVILLSSCTPLAIDLISLSPLAVCCHLLTSRWWPAADVLSCSTPRPQTAPPPNVHVFFHRWLRRFSEYVVCVSSGAHFRLVFLHVSCFFIVKFHVTLPPVCPSVCGAPCVGGCSLRRHTNTYLPALRYTYTYIPPSLELHLHRMTLTAPGTGSAPPFCCSRT